MNGSLIIQDMTGDWPVYPGHPLVLATAIMKLFPNFAAANAPTAHGWCAALGDSRIPGAGDHVGAAVRVLSLGAQGVSIDTMIQAAIEYWDGGRAGGHVKSVESGQLQAERIRPHFEHAARAWFAGTTNEFGDF